MIHVCVFLIWFRACFQIEQSSALGVREFLEEFLDGWSLGDGQYDAFIAEANVEHGSRLERHFILGIDEYLEVVEVYAVTLLATILEDVDLAISWVENAPLAEENRQVRVLSVSVAKFVSYSTDKIKAFFIRHFQPELGNELW